MYYVTNAQITKKGFTMNDENDRERPLFKKNSVAEDSQDWFFFSSTKINNVLFLHLTEL